MVVRLHIYSKEYYTIRKDPGKRQDRSPTPLAERARIAHHSETNLVPASLQGIVRKLGPADLVIAAPGGTRDGKLTSWQWRCNVVKNRLDKSSLAFI